MSEQFPSDAELHALSGLSDTEQEVPYPGIYESPYYTTFYKMLYRLLDVGRRAGDGRVYKDGTGLTFGVRVGQIAQGDTLIAIAGSEGNALADDAVNYIYLLDDGSLTVNATGFPSATEQAHVPLATIATGSASADGISGQYAIEDITDYRGAAFLQPVRGHAFRTSNNADLLLEPNGTGERLARHGSFSTNGDCQTRSVLLRGETTDATATELLTPGRFSIPDETVVSCEVHIIGRQDSGANHVSYRRLCLLERTGGTLALAGSVQTLGTDIETDSNWDVLLTADDGNKSLCVQVTGNTGQTVRWTAAIRAIELHHAD